MLYAQAFGANAVILSGSSSVSAQYYIAAVNSAGHVSGHTAAIYAAVAAPPDLYVATTTSGADIGSLNVTVGQTVQIDLVQEFANPAPTFAAVNPPSGLTVDPTTGLVTFTPTAASVGTLPVTFQAANFAGTSSYTFYFYVSVNQPAVRVSTRAVIYDGHAHAASATAVETDGVTPVAGSFVYTYNGSTTPPTKAGTYAVRATFTSADPAYVNAVATGTLTILPATPAVTLNSGSFYYNMMPHEATATAVGVDGVSPVDGDFKLTYNGDPNPPIGPGLFTVAIRFSSNDPDYASVAVTSDLIIYSLGTLTPTLTLVDGSAAYDGTAHADTASVVGVDGVTPVDGSFQITYNGNPNPPTQAGSYAVVANFISADTNYVSATIAGTMTISAVAPTLSVGSTTFYYNGSGQGVVATAVGLDGVTPVAGTFSLTYDGSTTLPVNAGTYDVTATFTSANPNYQSATTTGTLTILPATASIGLGNDGQWEFTYNGQPQSVAGSAYGWDPINGYVPINGYFTYEYFNEYGSNTQLFGPPLSGPPTDAGYYTFIETFTSLDPNYTGGSYSWELWIDPAAPTLVIGGTSTTYNGRAQPVSAVALGIDGVTPVAGSVTYATYNGSTTVPSMAGTYAVFVEWGSSDPNYYSSTGNATYVINKATPAFSGLSSPTVTTSASTVTVSGHIAAGSVSPGGDDVAITFNGVTQPVSISNGGSFSTTFNIQGLATGTYPITYEYLGDGSKFTAAGTTGLASGTLTVQAAPSVLTSPSSQTVVSGGSVTFTAAASGYPAPTVQWQQSTNGNNYSNISGATSLSYTISAATASQNGYHYRAVFTNSVGSATTAAATLTVQSTPTVTTNPSNHMVSAGSNVTFTAAATGNPAVSIQWQVSIDGGTTWSNITGATGTTLTLTAVTTSQNGYRYRVVFTNSLGSATTSSANLTVH